MPEIRVDLEILCVCGRELVVQNRYSGQIEVEPCEDCGRGKYNEGYDVGHKEASDG